MSDVELIYFAGCPNINDARSQLLKAFKLAGLPPEWIEWDNQSADAPAYTRQYGSPTILVKGKDVMQSEDSQDAACCRVYSTGAGLKGVPAVADIVRALKENIPHKTPMPVNAPRNKVLAALAMIPAMLSPLLPAITCPACWPAYAGLLSSMGIGFIDYTPYLLPVSSLFLGIALLTLWWKAPQRHGYRPFIAGLLASSMILSGKFAFHSDSLTYTGIGILLLATLWNVWPQKTSDQCPACEA